MAKYRRLRVMVPIINILTAIVVLADSVEEQGRYQDNPLARLNEELTGPDRTYDHQAWRAVGASGEADTSVSEIGENWKTDEAAQEPPRRRRPGRKRKRRPQPQPTTAVEGTAPDVQDGVRFNVESGIKVSYENADNERPRQRRPQRVQEDQHWRGQAVNEERPHRRRGHRRRQRPYVPDLGIEPSANGEQTLNGDTSIQVSSNDETEVRVVEDDFKVSPYTKENNNDNMERGSEQMKSRSHNQNSEITSDGGEPTDENEEMSLNKGEVVVDKSYRKPYSQAKKQEAEESAMVGGSSALKDLLKQSGGLSLSEVLQQRNLSLADLLTGKQYALSALKPTETSDVQENVRSSEASNLDDDINENVTEDNVNKYKSTSDHGDTDKRRRRLPPVNKDRSKSNQDEKTSKPIVTQPDNKRRLPPTNVYRRQKPKNTIKENEVDSKEVTTVKTNFVPNNPRKSLNDNLIKSKDDIVDTTDANTKNIIEDESENVVTTQETITTTAKKEKNIEQVRNRLSLKPRLRLPSVKTIPKRISMAKKNATEKYRVNSTIAQNEIIEKKAPIPNQAIPISIKDMFGMSDIVSAARIITKTKSGTKEKPSTTTPTSTTTATTYKAVTRSTTESTTIVNKPTDQPGKVSAKDEILEVLTDTRGGEKLTKILADRNMTLKELVEHRERGSSQVHLADIFHNASREPDPAEPFLAKSLIEPISKQIYPLKALLEGNMRESSNPSTKGRNAGSSGTPPIFVDFAKTSQNEESLGIVTLFDKFSEFVGHPKVFDAKEVKKDSDGASYFTSVINVKPTDEVYRESRSEAGFHNSHKQISEIYSSIPTFINTDGVVDAKVVQDWNIPNKEPNNYHHNNPLDVNTVQDNHLATYVDKDIDGDGLIILEDIQTIEDVDNHLAQASNQHSEENLKFSNSFDQGRELNFYTRLPVGVRSAIIVSSAIVGTSLIVFLTIFIACKWRQNRRNMLRYEESFATGRVKSPILDATRKANKNNSSSRSISPILSNGEATYRNQKINTMDSQTQRDAQEYLWDSLRKPFR